MENKLKDNKIQIRFFCKDRANSCVYYKPGKLGICQFQDRLECLSEVAKQNAIYLAYNHRNKYLRGE